MRGFASIYFNSPLLCPVFAEYDLDNIVYFVLCFVTTNILQYGKVNVCEGYYYLLGYNAM
jgi:hypothetical protein